MSYRLTRSEWKAAMEPYGDPMGFGRKQDFIFGSDSSSSPPPAAPAVQAVDPLVGQAMAQQASTADRVAQEAEARNKVFQPLYQQAAQQQLDVGADNANRSKAQWQDYNSLFRPAEAKYVNDAMAYDTPERRELEAQKAAAGVQDQFGLSNQQSIRDLTRMGLVAPNSDVLNATRGVSLARAATTAGAMNSARKMVEDTGAARVQGVAQFGRGLPSTGIAQDSLAIQGANSGAGTLMGANAAGIAAGNAGLPGWQGAAQTGIGIANANNSANMAAYNGQVNAWGQQQQANAASSAGLGSLIGTGLSVAQKAGWFSSKEYKEGGAEVDQDEVLAGLTRLPVETWKYKDGISDGGRHVGPYAEDVRDELGEHVAPGGKVIDPVSMSGAVIAGLQALAKKTDRIEAALGLKRMEVA
jgi:hypothetical protein